jgi:hypothetical protein
MRRFGRRALEKDLLSRHLASVLPHFQLFLLTGWRFRRDDL